MTTIGTGAGATLTLTTTAAVGLVEAIEPGGASIEGLEINTLASTGYMKMRPADLKSAETVTIEIYYETKGVNLEAAIGVVQTLTVTWPSRPGQSGNHALAGTGFITNVSYPRLAINEVQRATFEFTFDGATGPALTLAT